MQDSRYEIVEYYLFFTRTKLKHWLFRFLDSEIQHVYAMRKKCNEWIIINPLRSHIQIDKVPVDECIHPRCYDPFAVILPVKVKIDKNNLVYGFGVLSCVSVVKSLLGIRKRFILTPYQLFKYLKQESNHE